MNASSLASVRVNSVRVSARRTAAPKAALRASTVTRAGDIIEVATAAGFTKLVGAIEKAGLTASACPPLPHAFGARRVIRCSRVRVFARLSSPIPPHSIGSTSTACI